MTGQGLGIVRDVEVREEDIYVDVAVSPSRTYGGIKFLTPAGGLYIVPEINDTVVVQTLSDGGHVAHAPLGDTYRNPSHDLSPGDIELHIDSNTVLRFQKSGDTYDITLECDGNMNFRADNIFVGDEGDSKKVATEDHTHDFDYKGDGDNASTQSGTTKKPGTGLTEHEMK